MCLILALLCAAAAFAAVQSSDNSTDAAKVAIVVNEDSLIGRILINAIEEAYLSTLLEVDEVEDENTALSGIKNGDYVAAVVLPEGFIDDISRGIECHGRIYLSNKARSQTDMITSIVSFGERLMTAGQYGVFAGEKLINEYGLSRETHMDFLDRVNPELMEEALDFNSKYFIFETVDYHGTGMPTNSYFALCWMLLLLFLISLFFIPLLTRDCTKGMLNRLSAYGIGAVRFMRGKLILLSVTRAAIMAAAAAVFYRFGMVFIDAGAVICAVFSAVYITLVGAALTMCFGDGITGNVISGIIGMLLCGGIVPRQMLPDAVLTLGRFTPFGAAKALTEPLFGASYDVAALIAAMLYTFAAILLIKNKLSKMMAGRG